MIRLLIAVFIGGAIGAGMGYFGKCSTGACPLTATPWRGGTYGACMGALFAFLSLGSQSVRSEKVPEHVQKAGRELVVMINSQDDFRKTALEADKPVLVDMYADWCGPCKALAPTIDKLALDFKDKAVIAKLNVDEVTGPPKQFGVTGVPAVFIFHKGEVKKQLTGIQTAERYSDELNALLERKD